MKTDGQLQQDLIAELKWEPALHAAQIGVEVDGGVVTLAGTVGSYAEKWQAERAAQRVAGVRALAVEIEVELPALGRRNDADIARAAQNTLDWIAALPVDGVKVLVEDGWVTLSGQVDWQYQRQAASDAVRDLLGVVGLSNQIGIRAVPSQKEVQPDAQAVIQSDIEAALRRRAKSDAQTISVAVDTGDVTLTGTVHSWSERELAMHSAWGAPGVRTVIDRMTLNY